MSIIFMDGLDCYDNLADAQASGWGAVSTPSLNTTAGRFGGAAFIVDSASDTLAPTLPGTFALGDTATTGFSFYLTTVPISDAELIEFRSAAAVICRIEVTSGSTLMFYEQDGTAHSLGAITTGVWYRIEASILFGTTNTDGAVDIEINGGNVLSQTGVDTYISGTANLVELRWRARSTLAYRIDDITVTRDDGVGEEGFLGDIVIENLRPNANGTHTDWTATGTAWQDVDDALGSSDGDSTTITGTTVADKSSFELTDTVDVATTNYAVQVRAKIKKSDAGAKDVRGFIRSGTAEDNGLTVSPATTYGWGRFGIFIDDPDTAAALDETIIDGLEAGFEVIT